MRISTILKVAAFLLAGCLPAWAGPPASLLRNLPALPASRSLSAAMQAPPANRHYIAVSWTASTEVGAAPGVTCCTYAVLSSTVSGGPYAQLASGLSVLTYNDATGIGGTKYFYVIRAADSAGFLSPLSTEASATFLESPSAATGVAAVPH